MATKINGKPWEHGSFFHWMGDIEPTPTPSPWDGENRFYGCGRYAIRSLVSLGQATRGWKRLLVPSYYCHEVLADHVATGIEICGYPDSPEYPTPNVGDLDFRRGDVLLRVNYYGLRASLNVEGIDRDKVEVIDDHTHDPWAEHAWRSDADWCLLAFRKTLPMPDGCVLWSPRGHDLPPQPPVTPQHRAGVADGFAGMALKSLYLRGEPVSKDLYLRIARAAENSIVFGDTSGMAEISFDLLRGMPVDKWRNARRDNYSRLFDALQEVRGLRVMTPVDVSQSCPLGAILVFDSGEMRNHVRKGLISRHVYPAILWTLEHPVVDGVCPEQLSFSRRMLCVHCDMRYSAEDCQRVAGLVREAVSDYWSRGSMSQAMPTTLQQEVVCGKRQV